MGDLSAHFSRRELRCRHCGRELDARRLRHLVDHLERLRLIVGRPLVVVSGYRCPRHPIEAAKPGGPGEHSRGAVDLRDGYATEAQAASAGFTGIGVDGGFATHVDLGRKRRWRY